MMKRARGNIAYAAEDTKEIKPNRSFNIGGSAIIGKSSRPVQFQIQNKVYT